MQQRRKTNSDSIQMNPATFDELSTKRTYTALSEETEKQVAMLGNVHYQDELYYFQMSPESKKCAKSFMSLVANNDYARQLIANALIEKQKSTSTDGEKVWPNCISFITASVNGEKICFIALSGEATNGDKAKILHELDNMARLLNIGKKARNDEYHYAVITEGSPHFRQLIRKRTGSARHCSEYDYGALLAKLYEQYGDAFRVEGVANCAFYPFENSMETSYKNIGGRKTLCVNQKSVKSDIAKKFRHGEKFVVGGIGKQFEINLMPCCETCQQNKHAFISTLIHFQQRGKALALEVTQTKQNQEKEKEELDNDKENEKENSSQSEGRRKLRLSAIKELSRRETSMYPFFHKDKRHHNTGPSSKTVRHQPRIVEMEDVGLENVQEINSNEHKEQLMQEQKLLSRETRPKRSGKKQSFLFNPDAASSKKKNRKNNRTAQKIAATQADEQSAATSKRNKNKAQSVIQPKVITASRKTDSTPKSMASTGNEESESCCSTFFYGFWNTLTYVANQCSPNPGSESDDEHYHGSHAPKRKYD